MSVKALESELDLAKFVALSVVKARKAGTPLLDFVKSPEFEADLNVAIAAGPQVVPEVTSLSPFDYFELARYGYGFVADVVAVLKTA